MGVGRIFFTMMGEGSIVYISLRGVLTLNYKRAIFRTSIFFKNSFFVPRFLMALPIISVRGVPHIGDTFFF